MIAGISMCRDEADIIGWTLPRMAAQLDFAIVADNLSSDGTSNILHRISKDAGNVEIVKDNEPAYLQSEKMTHLADLARLRGATMVVPFDADEVWTCPAGRLADVLPTVPEAAAIIEAVLYDHVVTALDDPANPDVLRRIGWRRVEPSRLPKVACRILPGLVIGMGNHDARYPGPVKTFDNALTIHHYPYRSGEQMAKKTRNGADAYAAAGPRLPESTGQHWRDYGRLLDAHGPAAIQEVFDTWFYSADPENDPALVHDPCPL